MLSFKEKCQKLRRQDHTLTEIVEITGRAKSTVWYHIKDISLSQEKQKKIEKEKRERMQNYTPNEKGVSSTGYSPNKFKKWTDNRVLLVGHLTFDGEINRSECRYSSSHGVLVERVIDLIQEVYPHQPSCSVDDESGVVKAGFYNVELGIYMLEKQKELLAKIEDLSSGCQEAFLTAFFDDEGCVSIDLEASIRRIRGYQNDVKVLKLIQNLLSNFGIDSTIRENTCNEIVVSQRKNLEKFQEKINFSKGVRVNGSRANSVWGESLAKREILRRAIASYEK